MLALDPFVLGALAVHHVLSVLAHMRITLLSALPRRERSINPDGSQRGLRSSQAAGNRARRSRPIGASDRDSITLKPVRRAQEV
jgi:hypothetical protein